MTELIGSSALLGDTLPTTKDLLRLQAQHLSEVPVDHVTDCMDLFELITGQRGLSSDKGQRLAVMSLREDRMTGRTRYSIHCTTRAMLADGLTKPGIFNQLLAFATTGQWMIPDGTDVRARRRSSEEDQGFTEEALRTIDW